MIFLFLFFHGAVFYPEKLIEMINPEQAYIQKSAEILRYISVSIFMYGFFSVYFQTINGSGNTMASFMIEILCAIVYLLASYLLIKVLQVDVRWIWTNEYIYFGSMGILSMLYLKFFDWKKKVV
jgi:Na+-driven multidrug efflux pump